VIEADLEEEDLRDGLRTQDQLLYLNLRKNFHIYSTDCIET